MPRLDRWLWQGTGVAPETARAALVPASFLFGAASRGRTAAYDRGLLPRRRLPRPTISVGNLSVGGTGKTPVAGWIAGYCAARGHRPAILLRGYGGDEAALHREAMPDPIVEAHPNRALAAARAVTAGATVFVLDDAFQHREVHRDLDLVLVSAESGVPGRLLPAGPWREGRSALGRADLVIVTRKDRDPGDVLRALNVRQCAVAHLHLVTLRGLRSETPLPLAALRGRTVLASSGIGDPDSFAAQLRALGADVRRLDWPDHHPYRLRDVWRMGAAAAGTDHIIVTAKDAGKLRFLWPPDRPEPLVAFLGVTWEHGATVLTAALDHLLGRAPAPDPPSTPPICPDAAPAAGVAGTSP